MAKILYLSCHEILQWDECNLLLELGHQVFCPGAYVSEENKGDLNLRPGLPKCENYDELMEEWHKLGVPGKDNKECLTVDYVKRFDLVIVMHLPQWVHVNWETFKKSGVPVVWRTIGQSVVHNEKEMAPHRAEGMKIIRYSPREQYIPGYLGGDAMIRFMKDPDEFCDWNGSIKEVVTFGQHMQRRDPATNYAWFEYVTRPFPRKLFGPGSETLPFGKGKVSYPDLKQAMRDYRAYFYTGTWPASYTLNFIEAMMTGIPMVCIGPAKGHPHGWFRGHDLYEPVDIISNGNNGFCANSELELRSFIKQLLSDDKLAAHISKNGRATAIALFGKETVKQQWEDFFKTMGM
jgi:hypothetical protein